MIERRLRDGACSHAIGGLPCTGTATATIVPETFIFAPVGIIGVSSAELVGNFAVVFTALICVSD